MFLPNSQQLLSPSLSRRCRQCSRRRHHQGRHRCRYGRCHYYQIPVAVAIAIPIAVAVAIAYICLFILIYFS